MVTNLKRTKYVGYGMSIGILVGATVSAMTGDWATWIPVGLATGLAVGTGLAAKTKN